MSSVAEARERLKADAVGWNAHTTEDFTSCRRDDLRTLIAATEAQTEEKEKFRLLVQEFVWATAYFEGHRGRLSDDLYDRAKAALLSDTESEGDTKPIHDFREPGISLDVERADELAKKMMAPSTAESKLEQVLLQCSIISGIPMAKEIPRNALIEFCERIQSIVEGEPQC